MLIIRKIVNVMICISLLFSVTACSQPTIIEKTVIEDVVLSSPIENVTKSVYDNIMFTLDEFMEDDIQRAIYDIVMGNGEAESIKEVVNNKLDGFITAESHETEILLKNKAKDIVELQFIMSWLKAYNETELIKNRTLYLQAPVLETAHKAAIAEVALENQSKLQKAYYLIKNAKTKEDLEAISTK